MGLVSYMARKGAVGGTARWAAGHFWQTVNNREFNMDNLVSPFGFHKEVNKVISNALDSRFQGDRKHPDFIEIEALYNGRYGPGLAGFVKSILDTEAGYSKNTVKNIIIFDEIINEELRDSGVGPSMITGRVNLE